MVVKSLAAYEWAGNPAPRLHPTERGMLNAVGLQGPGVAHWLQHVLPGLVATGATVVASIWGRSVADYAAAADLLADAPAEVVAVEVNLSCPNLEGRRSIFAHDAELSARGHRRHRRVRPAAVGQAQRQHRPHRRGGRGRRRRPAPRRSRASTRSSAWPTTARRGDRRSAPAAAGCRARPSTRSPCAPSTTSTPPCPTCRSSASAGVATGWDAEELMLAGAVAVQVGTATFADPRASLHVLRELG